MGGNEIGESHAVARPRFIPDFAPPARRCRTMTPCARRCGSSPNSGATSREIEAIAHACGVTPDELHHLFRRWAGLTPKAFLQALTIDHAARACCGIPPACWMRAYEVGLSGPGRLHDLFVTHEAMSPGEWKTRRRRADSCSTASISRRSARRIVVATERGLAGLGFCQITAEERAAIWRHAAALAARAARRKHRA